MNKVVYSCLIILLIFSSGCHHASTNPSMIPEHSASTAMTDVEDDINLVLQEYNRLLQPILDYSVFHQINQFSGQVVLWASAENRTDITVIQMLYHDLTRTLNPMMQTMELSGYGFKADWDLLTQQVNHMHNQLDQVMAAVEDGDVGRAVSLQNVDGQTDLLKTALVIEGKISTARDRLQIPAAPCDQAISEEDALSVVANYVTLLDGQSIQDGAIREIDGREYYLFTINNEFSVDDAYCVDVATGQLYQCDEALILTPVIE